MLQSHLGITGAKRATNIYLKPEVPEMVRSKFDEICALIVLLYILGAIIREVTSSVNNLFQDTNSYQLESSGSDEMASVLLRGDQDYMEEINELYTYIDNVKNMVTPGCSEDLLKATLNSMSSLLSTISFMSAVPRLQASL